MKTITSEMKCGGFSEKRKNTPDVGCQEFSRSQKGLGVGEDHSFRDRNNEQRGQTKKGIGFLQHSLSRRWGQHENWGLWAPSQAP